MMARRTVQKMAPNTLPLPFMAQFEGGKQPESTENQERAIAHEPLIIPDSIDMNDRFPKGRIVKYFKEQRYGFIHDQTGREIFFSLEEMDIVDHRSREDIRVGTIIGYDLSRTSRGLRVKRMKIY